MRSKFGSKFESSLFDLENCQVILNSLSSRPSNRMFDLWSQPVGLDLLGKVHVSRLSRNWRQQFSLRKIGFPECYAALSLDAR